MTYRLYDHMEKKIILDEEKVIQGYILNDMPSAFNLTGKQEAELEKLIEDNEEEGVYDLVLTYLDDNNIEHVGIGTCISHKETYYITVEEEIAAGKEYSHCLYLEQLEDCDFCYEDKTHLYEYWNGSNNDVIFLDDLSGDLTLEITNLDEELDLPTFNTGYLRVFKGTHENGITEYYLVQYSLFQGVLPYVDFVASSPTKIREHFEGEEDY